MNPDSCAGGGDLRHSVVMLNGLSVALRALLLSLVVGLLSACADTHSLPGGELALDAANAQRIFGGEDVEKGDSLLNFVVAIDSEGIGSREIDCTGTLIHKRVVLTAGHCMDLPELFIKTAHIRFRTLDFDESTERNERLQVAAGNTRRALNIVRPQRWNELFKADPRDRARLGYDVALILLDQDAPEGTRPVRLSSFNPSSSTLSTLTTVGFGAESGTLESFEGQRSLFLHGAGPLRRVDLTRLPREESEMHFETYQQLKGICYGDSGAPALINMFGQWVQIGVASYVTNAGTEVCRQKGFFLKLGFKTESGETLHEWIQRSVLELTKLAP